MKKLIHFFFILSIITSCQSQQDELASDSPNANKVFNLMEFMNEEIDYLESNNIQLTKIISINGKEEKRTFEDVNWKEELTVVGNMNIDKIAWVDAFTIDTIVIDEAQMQVIYKSDDLQIPITSMILHIEHDVVKTIEIDKERKSFFFNSDHHIKYESRKGYSLRGYQKALFISKHEMKLSAYYN